MELRGLEPLTSGLPDRRSSQLSYSPFEFEVVRKVSTCKLPISSGCESQMEIGETFNDMDRNKETAVRACLGRNPGARASGWPK